MSVTSRAALVGAAVVALVVFGPIGSASAFHEGGVAYCSGCHTMHNSADNPIGSSRGYNPDPHLGDHLLKGGDASSTCLNCHFGSGGYHILSSGGTNTNQGGDFYWITQDYSVILRGTTPTFFSKDNHGHNIVAGDFGLLEDQDPDNAEAPGGTYPASALGCNSCHDPHGRASGGTRAGGTPISVSGSYGEAPAAGTRAGNYRLLGDTSYEPPGAGGANFSHDAPVALTANQSGGSYGYKVAYGSGMSEWCANCHTEYLDADPLKHPAGNLAKLGTGPDSIGANYNSYVKTGDFTGDVLTAYDSLVPFERGTADQSLLNVDSTAGTDADSNVMCLTCHRAHASAHANSGKWDFQVELLSHSIALQTGGAPAGSAVYYKDGAVVNVATAYGEYQRSLCNKCHVQD